MANARWTYPGIQGVSRLCDRPFVIWNTRVIWVHVSASAKGIDNTLEKAKAILQQAGEVTQNQIEALEDFIRGVFRAQTQDIDPNDPERDGSRDRKLSNGEIQELKDAGEDIHELKRDCEGGAAKCDLYKDRDGNIYVKPKGGRGPGDFTGLNINDF
ncbi:MAG: polymorphic toxin type 33 domain-containing protein [Coleofasciculus sp. G1-WW12-02]|uniref:polymorphic toxin type 33 domain-containing protein n=1 Tax=Coleofasciculus sp. G1-WW12-02 TaxID=3068483 RepID=UPI0032F0F5FD